VAFSAVRARVTMVRVLLLALVLTLLGAATLASLRRAAELRGRWPAEADTFYLPSSRTLKLLSLGHHELFADLIAAKTNVYFGTQILGKGAQRWLPSYINTAADLDPHFHRLYLSGAAMLVYNGQEVTKEMVLAANELLERGLKVFPLDWELHFQLGFNNLYELPKLAADDQRVPQWRQRGVEALQKAALFDDVPGWLPGLVARVLTKSGSDELAIRHLEQAYAVAATEEARLQIFFKLRALRGKDFSQQLEEERRKFQQMIDGRYPYAPDSFSVATGPRRGRAVELPGSR
jgi:hypothetical protein